MKSILFAAYLLFPALLFARTASDIADHYARDAVSNNMELRAAKRQIDLSRADRRAAFGKFLPVVDIRSRHTWAGGGRDLKIDINDFLPPEIMPTDLPPTVIPFQRTKEQETKIQVVQPLFAGGGILSGYRAARKMESAAEADYRVAKSDLSLQVRTTFFRFLQARELSSVRREDLESAQEQLRVTRTLFENDKLPLSELRRAEAADASAQAGLLSSEAKVRQARHGLNLLLSRALNSKIEIPQATTDPVLPTIELENAVHTAQAARPELKNLDHAVDALTEQKRAVRSRYLPAVSAAFEYGFQGEKYEFKDENDYYLLSGVLSWNLFEGFRSNVARQKAEISRRQLQDKKQWLRDVIEQQVSSALLDLEATHTEHQAAKLALEAARESHRLIEIRFREGMAAQLEMIDARGMLARAASQEVIARYGYLIAAAKLDHSMGKTQENKNS